MSVIRYVYPSVRMDVWIRITVIVSAIYTLFNAVSVALAADSILTTRRHAYVFDNIASQDVFAVLYMALTVFLIISAFWPKLIVYPLTILSLSMLFWAAAAIFPPFVDDSILQGNLLGTGSYLLLAFFTGMFATLSYYEFRPINSGRDSKS